MKSIFAKLILSAALAFGLVSCADIVAPGYGGGYGSGYGGGSRYYNDGYRNDYHRDHDDCRYRQDPRHVEPSHKYSSHEHCYCSHKSCGCKPGHPKGGCQCDGGAHRH